MEPTNLVISIIFATFIVAGDVEVIAAANPTEQGCNRDSFQEVNSQSSHLLELIYAKLEKLEVRFNNLESQLDKSELRQINRLTSLVCQSENKITPQTKVSEAVLRNELAQFSDAIVNNVTESLTSLIGNSFGPELNKFYTSRGYLSEYHDIFNTGKAEYRLMFRGTAHVGTSFYHAYKDGVGIPSPVEDGCKSSNFSQPCSSHYRNNAALDSWCNIEEVVFGVVDNKSLVKTIVFSGADTTYMDWFQQKNLKESSYVDLKTESKNFFSKDGDATHLRRFFINRQYGGCPGDAGWVVATDRDPATCPWENTFSAIPKLIYSGSQHYINWTSGDRRHADAFVIFVKYRNS